MLFLILAVVAIQAVVWLAIYLWLKRRLEAARTEVRVSSVRQGEKIVLGPASSNYRGADFTYGRVKGNGVLCVTDTRIVFQRLVGGIIEIPLRDVVDVTVAKWFRGTSIGTGAVHLVMHTADHNRIGFLVRGAEEWKLAIEGLLHRGRKGPHEESF
jgi:hypothetical protein